MQTKEVNGQLQAYVPQCDSWLPIYYDELYGDKPFVDVNGRRHTWVEEHSQWIPVLFSPLPGPQATFMASTADNILYGGARGGGKTECGLAEAARWGFHPDYKALILRRTYPRLVELMDRAKKLYPDLGWKQSDKDFVHQTTGAIIRFGHCQYPKDVNNYLTSQYQRIIIDQAEEFTERMLLDLATCCRTKVREIPARMILMCNWGNVGHLYLKKTYYDKCKPVADGPKRYNPEFDVWWQPESPGQPYKADDGMTYQFIPAKVFENKYIMENDKTYVNRLKKLPEEKRKSHLDGNPDAHVGQFFEEFDEKTHVVKPFRPSFSWKRWMSLDYGSTKPFVAMLHTVNPATQEAYTYGEYWAQGKTLRYHAKEVARKLLANEPHLEGIIYPHDMHRNFKRDETDTDNLIERFIKHLDAELKKEGKVLRLTAEKGIWGSNTRVLRWEAMKGALSEPWWYVTSNCEKLIETLPSLVKDEDNNPDDILECDFDHWVEATSHFIVAMTRRPDQVENTDYMPPTSTVLQQRKAAPMEMGHWLTW